MRDSCLLYFLLYLKLGVFKLGRCTLYNLVKYLYNISLLKAL